MKSIASYGTMVLIAALAACWRGWNDGWYLIAGLITAGIPVALLTTWCCFHTRRRQGRPSGDESTGIEGQDDDAATGNDEPIGASESIVVGGLQGVALGIALSVYLAAAFALLQQVPWVYDPYYDADRVALEAKLSTLEQAENYREAVTMIEDRLAQKASRAWRRSLAERQYGDLVHLVGRLSATQRLPLLTKACELAKEHKFDAAAARALQEQAAREEKLAIRLDELCSHQDWVAVVDILKSELLRDEKSAVTARLLYDAYCAAAVHSESSEKQVAFYSQAVELAGRFGLPPDRAQAALSQIQSAQGDQADHERSLAKLARESAEVRQKLIEVMLRDAAELPMPDARLVAMRRIETLSVQHGVELPSLSRQLAELNETVAKQRELLDRVKRLRQEPDHEKVIALLAPAVRTSDRRQWIKPLDKELLDCLHEWCDAVSAGDSAHVEARRERLQRAIKIATDCELDVPVLKQRLAVIDADVADRARIRAKIAELTREGRLDDLVAYLKVRIEERPESEWALPYGHELYKTLVGAALESADLDRRGALLRDAVAIATKYRLQNANEATLHLATTERSLQQQVDEERRRTAPVELPQGTKAGIGKISTDSPPFVVVDAWVENGDDTPVMGLQSKDFAVTVDGQKLGFVMQPVAVDALPGRFALVVDISGSASPVLPVIKSGISELAIQLAKTKAQMKLIPFNAEVNTKLPWTGDGTAISTAIRPLKAEGGTALYRALFAAVEELGRQPTGARHIILFTDGKDSEGGVSLDDVLLQCRAKGISVTAIGLQTNELDPMVLKKLTTATGGQYTDATDPAELGTRFTEASHAIRRHRYRLVVDVSYHDTHTNRQGVVSVAIGRNKPIVAESPFE